MTDKEKKELADEFFKKDDDLKNIDGKIDFVPEGAESDDVREKLAEKFRAKVADNNLDEDEDVREFISQKSDGVVGNSKDVDKYFDPIKPQTKTNYTWTIVLIVMIVFALVIVVYLVMTGKGGPDVSKQQELSAYNEYKDNFDKIFLTAVNDLNQAEADFNAEKYVTANDGAKEAEDGFDQACDYLYDVGSVDLEEEEFKFLTDYFGLLEDVCDLGGKMANSLSYMARSADRGEYAEAQKSLTKYHAYAEDMASAMDDIEKIKKSNSMFFK